MGCAPSSLNNNVRPAKVKGCYCSCHTQGLQDEDDVNLLSTNGSQNGAVPETFKEDPRIPLTGRQIFLIKRSWKGIGRNMSATGLNMFLSLFEKNAGLINFFEGLQAYKTLAELRTSKVLESHVKGVMLTVDEAITNLDDADYTINMLLAVGNSHTRFKNFDPNAFLLLEEPFLMAVSDTLGDRYSVHMEDIYRKAIEFILNTLILGFGPTDHSKGSDRAGQMKKVLPPGYSYATKRGPASAGDSYATKRGPASAGDSYATKRGPASAGDSYGTKRGPATAGASRQK